MATCDDWIRQLIVVAYRDRLLRKKVRILRTAAVIVQRPRQGKREIPGVELIFEVIGKFDIDASELTEGMLELKLTSEDIIDAILVKDQERTYCTENVVQIGLSSVGRCRLLEVVAADIAPYLAS